MTTLLFAFATALAAIAIPILVVAATFGAAWLVAAASRRPGAPARPTLPAVREAVVLRFVIPPRAPSRTSPSPAALPGLRPGRHRA